MHAHEHADPVDNVCVGRDVAHDETSTEMEIDARGYVDDFCTVYAASMLGADACSSVSDRCDDSIPIPRLSPMQPEASGVSVGASRDNCDAAVGCLFDEGHKERGTCVSNGIDVLRRQAPRTLGTSSSYSRLRTTAVLLYRRHHHHHRRGHRRHTSSANRSVHELL